MPPEHCEPDAARDVAPDAAISSDAAGGPDAAFRAETGPPPAPPAFGRGVGNALPDSACAPLSCRSAKPGRRTSRVAFFEDEVDPDDPLLGFAPYHHKAPRRNSITPERQRAFIAALAASGIVTQAARSIGASLEALYKLRHMPGAEGFSAAWDMAVDRGIARLEDCALERAIMGEERPVVSQGRLVATWTRYDTALLLFFLRHRRSERYGPDHDPQPGSALFEKVRARIEADRPSPAEVIESINRKLDIMRENAMRRREIEG